MSQLKGFFKRPFHRSTSGMSDPNSPAITLAVIGCGERGKAYAQYCLEHPKDGKIVAIAEPRPTTRRNFAAQFGVDYSLVFDDWTSLLAASAETISTVGRRLADGIIIAVQDQMHCEVVLAFAEQGYHMLCEKPLATSVEDCIMMKDKVEEKGIIFALGHVLRYSSYTQELTKVIRSGQLGELVNIVHMEPVGYWHFAHSYCRGSWSNEEKSSFSLMTKCCHDIDLICHWMAPATLVKVSSFGSLKHFRKESKPWEAGNATRCLDCPIKESCPYSAKKIYLDPLVNTGWKNWPASVIVDGEPDIENITDALKNGDYGRCVYESDNDVCDNQIVNFQFSNGSTCSFTMVAFTSLFGERQTRMHFTNGDLHGDMTQFTTTDWTRSDGTIGGLKAGSGSKVHTTKMEKADQHGGGDFILARTFIQALREGKQEVLDTNLTDILNSHLAVFAAEESRKTGQVVLVAEFEREVRERMELARPAVRLVGP